jgi:hypothetical protein
MTRAGFQLGSLAVALAVLCRCSLAYDLDGLDEANGGAAGADAAAGRGGAGGHDASDDASAADAADDGMAGSGGAPVDASTDSSGGSAGTGGPDAALDGSGGSAGADAGTLTLGLVAHYRFDETSGTSAADATGNNAPATLRGGASFAAGRQNNAVELSGTDEYVSLPANIASSYGAFSLSVWVRLNTSDGWARVFDFGTGTTRYLFFTPRTPDNQARFAISTAGAGGEQRLNGAPLSTGSWHHVVVTLTGDTGVLYVNGAQVAQNASLSLAPADLGNTSANWLGRSQFTADPYLNGRIDNLRMYSRVLSLQEVQALQAGGL